MVLTTGSTLGWMGRNGLPKAWLAKQSLRGVALLPGVDVVGIHQILKTVERDDRDCTSHLTKCRFPQRGQLKYLSASGAIGFTEGSGSLRAAPVRTCCGSCICQVKRLLTE